MLKKYSELAEMFARLVAEGGDQNVVIDWWSEDNLRNEVDDAVEGGYLGEADQSVIDDLKENPSQILDKIEENLSCGGVLPGFDEVREIIINMAE